MKTVLITGASGNLGRFVTAHFLSRGYKVVAVVSKEDSKKNILPQEGLQVEAVDLTDETAAGALVQQAIARYGAIDAALMLAGAFTMGRLGETATGDIQKLIALNFETAYNLARPLYLHMQERGSGRLVFIGARPALQPAEGKNMMAYALSKSLLFRLAEYLNEGARGKNIVATVVVPSTLDTPANRADMPAADPGKWVQPEELARVLEFVCSDEAAPLRETILKVYNNA
ncbi:SDR family NAD(P)-dependent oxidoreductase [Paraflavisolibacter sp. H34]|uniref:SDR family NAD(P)-dependent oxidoreductase n=1 Tax=Huijunlia imazamoxiresistens TaxID=3127457 RepID=UPI0030189A25